MELNVVKPDNSAASKLKVSDQLFGAEFNEDLVHQVVTAYMAGARAGTKAQKNRSAVRGGGCKPWRQKGTGRARAGTIRSPIWRGGGVTFAAKPRDHSQKVNRSMYRRALSSILSELVRQERLVVLNELKLSAPKTREMVKLLEKLDLKNVLIVIPDADSTIELATRNIPNVALVTAAQVNPVQLVGYEKVLMLADALAKLEARLA